MATEVLEQFISINNRYLSDEISLEEACASLQNLNFLLLSLDGIELVENADWIPDDIYANIFRSWIENQDNNIYKIIAYLPSTTTISKSQMLECVDQIVNPSNPTNLIVENIIEKLATGGGNREYKNPVELGLITASSSDEKLPKNFQLLNLFSGKPTDKFHSSSKANSYFFIDFPPYMRIRPTSYTLMNFSSPGPKSWVLQASNGGDWVEIAKEIRSDQLRNPGALGIFPISDESTSYRSFKFINTESNWDGNNSIVLCSFDISGEIIYVSNKEY